ncbi:MAG: DUF3168 domain-containing protein [Rhodobacteraceae bacterium]|nr:DUF3168 domain-containing protein [Paracoccaceae bacterium]
MSYGMASGFQAAVFGRLTGDTALTALVGTAVYDALPAGALPVLYVVLGKEIVRNRSDVTCPGAEHEFTVSVITETAGFAKAKQTAGAISDALCPIVPGPELVLTRGRVVYLNFHRASAARIGTGSRRRIDLIFRARLEEV